MEPNQSDVIINAYGHLLAKRLMIYDASLLPYPRSVIHEALLEKEHRIYLTIQLMTLHDEDEAEIKSMRKLLADLVVGRFALAQFSEIDPTDKDLVDFLNTFTSPTDIPESNQLDWTDLFVKYSKKGQDESIREAD
jgi:hypothetical protein